MESDVHPTGSERRTSTASPTRSRQQKPDLDKIIEGCRKGRADSQEALYKRFYGYAMSAALAYSPSRDDALEVVNDSFMKVFDNMDRFNESTSFKPWLRRIVVNTAIDQARRMKRFNASVELEPARLEVSMPVTVEEELHEKQIYELMNRLPDMLRFVFNMYEVEGYSHREISEKLQIAESSSRTYLTRAKQKLRELYRSRFPEQ